MNCATPPSWRKPKVSPVPGVQPGSSTGHDRAASIVHVPRRPARSGSIAPVGNLSGVTTTGAAVDTTDEIRALVVRRLRAMSPAERFQRCIEMTDAVEQLTIAGIRAAHPGIADEDIPRELARRRYGDALADAAYGHAVPRATH